MSWTFDDYRVTTGYTNQGHIPIAWIEEFACLVAQGQTHEEAIAKLRREYAQRVDHHRQNGIPIPAPGSGKARPTFAPSNEVQALGPLVHDFWNNVLGTSYATSFVSNESRLSTWEHYCQGGRDEIIQRVKERYGVDISALYDDPIPRILKHIKEKSPKVSASRLDHFALVFLAYGFQLPLVCICAAQASHCIPLRGHLLDAL